MEDIYEYSNNIEGLPQTKYVSTSREINQELKIDFCRNLKNSISQMNRNTVKFNR